MKMTQSVKIHVFGCIAAWILAFLFAVADTERTNPCSETQYWVEYADGSNKCEDCPSCPPGQGLSEECGKRIKPSTFVICQPCQPKFSFSSKDDTSGCALCSSCSQYQVVLRNCTPELDIKCAKRCSSNRYYNDAKGECLPCSKCCGDDHDLVEVECQEKLGPDSNMICSFDTSVNRCGKATNLGSQNKHTTIAMKITATPDNYTSPSQGSKSEQTESSNLFQRKDRDFWTAAIIPAVILALMVTCCCVYTYKTWHPNGWCRGDPEMGSGAHALGADGAEEASSKNDRCHRFEMIQPESLEPLLKEGVPEILSCICEVDSKRDGAQEKMETFDTFTPCMLETMPEELREPLPKEGDFGVLPRCSEMATKKDSKLLSSLLERESDLQKICECLDAPMPGVGHYRAVALFYGFSHYQIVSVFEKQPGEPSRALMESLQAKKPELTVAEFASVVRKEANRNDVVKLLEEYDSK